jgi:putative nucleotidyltransferase with HDIG domain
VPDLSIIVGRGPETPGSYPWILSGGMTHMIEAFEAKIRETIEYLPPVPIVMSELVEAINDENADFQRVGNIISKDPSMSMNILKIANSAFYRIPNRVSTIDHAVRMIGMREVASLCLACTALKALKPSPTLPVIDLTAFWRHSVATGVFARLLCRELNIGLLNNLYLAGLMHDVGKIVIDRFAHEVYKAVIAVTSDEGISFIDAEQRVMGGSHDKVGGWLMEKWRLPLVYINVAKYHHAANEAPEESRVMASLISFADQLVRLRNFGFGGGATVVVLKDLEAYKNLERLNSRIRNMDFVKFVFSMDNIEGEIADIETVMQAS